MRQIRLFVDTDLAPGSEQVLPAFAAEHAMRALRLRSGDHVILFNGDGHDYPATLTAASKREALVTVDSRLPLDNESPLRLGLAQALARGEKMDLIMQKATELGVTRIVPLQTRRCDVRLDSARAEKRLTHWRGVVISACEQCGRARIPVVEPVQTLRDWTGTLPDAAVKRLMLTPGEGCRARELPDLAQGAVVMAGPEGGLDPHDLATLRSAGFEALNLGPRILRTESAGLTALAALQALFGDI